MDERGRQPAPHRRAAGLADRKLWKTESRGAPGVPVIMITAYGDAETKARRWPTAPMLF